MAAVAEDVVAADLEGASAAPAVGLVGVRAPCWVLGASGCRGRDCGCGSGWLGELGLGGGGLVYKHCAVRWPGGEGEVGRGLGRGRAGPNEARSAERMAA